MTILVLLMLNLLIAKSQKQCAEIVDCKFAKRKLKTELQYTEY